MMWKRKAGVHLLRLMPKRAERIKRTSYSMTIGRHNIFDSFVRAGIAEQHLRDNRLSELAMYHQQFWAQDGGTRYHQHVRSMVLDTFIQHYAYIINEVKMILSEMRTIDTIVEVGCGGGSLLNHLLSQFDTIDRFVGIDLSAETIAQNEQLYPNRRLEWVVGDGKKWIKRNGTSNMLIFSFRGVFEYFTQTDLSMLFSHIATQMRPSVLMVIEPIGLSQRLTRQLVSENYGDNHAWSHNYPSLIQDAGFDVRHVGIQMFEDHRMVAVIGVSKEKAFSYQVNPADLERLLIA